MHKFQQNAAMTQILSLTGTRTPRRKTAIGLKPKKKHTK